jgi:hypothetical protein
LGAVWDLLAKKHHQSSLIWVGFAVLFSRHFFPGLEMKTMPSNFYGYYFAPKGIAG